MTDAEPAPVTAPTAAAPSAPAEPAPIGWTNSFLPLKIGEGSTGPVIPIYAASLGATAGFIGLMEALFSAVSILGAFAWGRTSDEVAKRKPFIVAGFAGTFLALLFLYLARGPSEVLPARLLMGFVMAAYVAVGGALIADGSTQATIGSRMGRLNTVGGLGYSVGLLVGAAVLHFRGLRDVFGAAALFTMAGTVMATMLIREPDAILRRRDIHRLFRNAAIPFSMPVQRRVFVPTVLFHRPKWTQMERRAWAYLLAISLAFLGTGTAWALLPLHLTDLGASPTMALLVFLVHALVSTLAFGPAGVLAERVGYRKVQVGGLASRAVVIGCLALPMAQNPYAVAGLFVLAGLTWAVLNTTGPAALFRGMEIRKKGELVGLFNVAAGVGLTLGALLAGLLAEFGGFPRLFTVAAALTAISTFVTARVVYPRGLSALA